jgi:hypothetical protein
MLKFICRKCWVFDSRAGSPKLNFHLNMERKAVPMKRAYDADDCNTLSLALEKAWEIYLRTGRLTSQNIDVAKGALSYALLDAAEAGERNIARLAIAAVGRMARYEVKLRSARSPRLDASSRQSA